MQFKSARPDQLIHFSLKQLKTPVRKSPARADQFKLAHDFKGLQAYASTTFEPMCEIVGRLPDLSLSPITLTDFEVV